jgi:hypothetical protein
MTDSRFRIAIRLLLVLGLLILAATFNLQFPGVNIWKDATGHATLWNGQSLADEGAHDYTNIASEVLFWPIQ